MYTNKEFQGFSESYLWKLRRYEDFTKNSRLYGGLQVIYGTYRERTEDLG